MTELEAEALAARLTRVWVPERVCSSGLDDEGDGWRFSFYCEPAAGVTLSVQVYSYQSMEVVLAGTYSRLRWSEECPQIKMTRIHPLMDVLTSSPRPTLLGLILGALHPRNRPAKWETEAEDFRGQWWEVFRRGCWLSGCPIEASAHEKVEWIRDFTREEVESWNFNF